VTIRSRLSALVLVVALSLASLLGGCAATAGPGYRDRVEQIARQAAGGDISGALGALDSLAADVSTSAGTGELTAPQADRIAAAIDAVRIDLLALAPAPEPSAEPAPAPVPAAEPSGTSGLEGDSTDEGKNGVGSGKGKGKGRPDD
jgi:hypothetical protein